VKNQQLMIDFTSQLITGSELMRYLQEIAFHK